MSVFNNFHEHRTTLCIQRLYSKVIDDNELLAFHFCNLTYAGVIGFSHFSIHFPGINNIPEFDETIVCKTAEPSSNFSEPICHEMGGSICVHYPPYFIQRSTDIFNYFYPFLCDLHREEFWILFLKRNSAVIGSVKVSSGGLSQTLADPKIIFKHALEQSASSIVLCHNNPSGSVQPSAHDVILTQRMRKAGIILQIGVRDHIIIGDGRYFSFADDGLML